jgi:Skp family chaperone for outer membrane proteins
MICCAHAEDKAVTVTQKKETTAQSHTPSNNKTSATKKNDDLIQKNLATVDVITDKNMSDLVGHTDVRMDAVVRVVESYTIMGESEKGQLKRSEIESKRDFATEQIQEKSKDFEKSKNSYVAKSTTMSDSAREKEEKQLMKMERDIKNFVSEKEEELKLDMQIATESLAQDLERSVTQLAQNENIDIVIDKMTGRAIYVSPKFDITHKAIEEMNKTYKVELAQNKQAESNTKVADNKAVAAPKAHKVSA